MFHKEGSIQGRKKAMDVPVRKAERRKLLERARNYFADVLLVPEVSTTSKGTSSSNKTSASATSSTSRDNETNALDAVLGATFLQGALSARSLPLGRGSAWTMILYLKRPTSTGKSVHATATTSTTTAQSNSDTASISPIIAPQDVWPYTSSQFVWMAMEEKNTVVKETPTVPLWAVLVNARPQLLKLYAIWIPSPVSKFVCRGADLMRAGIRSLPGRQNFNSKLTWSDMLPIAVEGNNQPFAVGHLINPQDPIGIGVKGVGVQIWNAYGDDLWRFSNTNDQCKGNMYINAVGGALFDNGHYGNLGFQQGELVLPLDDSWGGRDECDDASSQSNIVEPQDSPLPQEKQHLETQENNWDQLNEQICFSVPETNSNVDTSTIAEVTGNTTMSATRDVRSPTPDNVLHRAVLQGLLAMKNKDFPIPSGTFYAQYVIPYRPIGTTIDLKSTTYKKFGVYLKAQVERGLLQAGPDKTNPKNMDPMASITGFYKKHSDFQDVEKLLCQPDADSLQHEKMVMVSLYIIPSHWVSLLRLREDDVSAASASSDERKGTGMLTAAEARKILETYINQESLVPSEKPQLVQLDGPLTKILYHNEDMTQELQSRKDLVKQFMGKLLPGYALVQMPGNKIVKLAKGLPPKVEIEVSLRQSKKFVTRVRGLENYAIDPASFSRDISRRLACSATVETTASSGRPALRKNRVELVFQGNIALEIEAMLVDESLSTHGGIKGSTYSVPKQVVDVILRKGVPVRKGTKK